MAEMLALDRATVRTYDQDGHLHIAVANLSRAEVSPYKGAEIPDYDRLRLNPQKTYFLLRPANELARAASSFNGKPLLLHHRPVTSDEHPAALTVGAVGNDVVFQNPWMRGSLTVWDQRAIDAIESGAQKHAAGYRYVPVMRPGTFEGQRFDGIMSELAGNHIALVSVPRVEGAVVGDAKPLALQETTAMADTARREALATGLTDAVASGKVTLAQDATIEQLVDLLSLLEPSGGGGAPAAGPGMSSPGAGAELPPGAPFVGGGEPGGAPGAEMDPGLDPAAAPPDPSMGATGAGAMPAPPEEEDAFGAGPEEAPPGAPPGAPGAAGGEASPLDELLDFLTQTLTPEQMQHVRMLAQKVAGAGAGGGPPGAEAPPPGGPPGGEPKPPSSEAPSEGPPKEKDDKDMSSDRLPPRTGMDRDQHAHPGAMDEAAWLKRENALIARLHSVQDALRAVRPFVGDLHQQFDDPSRVYKFALDSLGVKTEGVHPSAFPVILSYQKQPSDDAPSYVAMDEAANTAMTERYKHINRLRTA